jgi:hypothetical protein
MNNNGFCAAAFRLGAVPDSQWANGRSTGHEARPFSLAGVPPMGPVNLRPAYIVVHRRLTLLAINWLSEPQRSLQGRAGGLVIGKNSS